MRFVLGIEIFALAIRKKSKTEDITVGSREIKLTQNADDTTVLSELLEMQEKKLKDAQGKKKKKKHTKSETL